MTFIIAVLVALVALLGGLGVIALGGNLAFWLAFVAFLILALAAWVPGL
jgi:hypothetical protein